MIKPVRIAEVKNQLGEGVIWDHRTQLLQWTDIESACFWQWDISDQPPQRYDLPERLGSYALTADPDIYLGAFESGFARFSVKQPLFEPLAPITRPWDHLRMNDGRVDRTGQFWAGSMAEKEGSPLGSLWRYGGPEAVTAHIADLRIPNSLCWSGDGRIMYFADSPRNTIWRYGFDSEAGPVGAPEIFARTPSDVHPDGSCVDARDHVWNAQWGGGELVCYCPDGTVDQRLALPVSQPSCVTFAGANLDLLCVTTARVDLDAAALAQEPLAGALLVYRLDVTGRPEEICVKGL